MPSYVPAKKNSATGLIFYVSLVDQSNTKLFKSNPTLASGDVKLSIDGGAFANLGTLPTVTPASGRAVKVTLSQAETNGDNLLIVFSDAAGAEWCDLAIGIQTASQQVDDIPTAAQNATGWGASVVGNSRTRDMYLQGLVNKIAFAADGESYTLYSTDDATPLATGTATRLATSVGGLRSVDPA